MKIIVKHNFYKKDYIKKWENMHEGPILIQGPGYDIKDQPNRKERRCLGAFFRAKYGKAAFFEMKKHSKDIGIIEAINKLVSDEENPLTERRKRK
jgi:hypothetical protein